MLYSLADNWIICYNFYPMKFVLVYYLNYISANKNNISTTILNNLLEISSNIFLIFIMLSLNKAL